MYPRVDVFDPKGEIAPFLVDETNARVFEHESASGAAASSVDYMYKTGQCGICVIEEVMTVPPGDYAEMIRLAAIRRKDTGGDGVAIYATTQRPKIMPVAFRSTADMWLVGAISDDDDLKAIEKTAGPEFVQPLSSAQIGEFHAYTFGKDIEEI